MLNILTLLFIFTGIFFFFVGSLGLIRFPDALTRAHGAAKCDTLGAIFILIGLILQTGFAFSSLKLILVIIFLWITNPTATHAIAKAIRGSMKGDESNDII